MNTVFVLLFIVGVVSATPTAYPNKLNNTSGNSIVDGQCSGAIENNLLHYEEVTKMGFIFIVRKATKTFHNFCSSNKNRTRNYAAAPLHLASKKVPDNFLGQVQHHPLTVDAKTSYNRQWMKSSNKFAKLSPQTSQTSFSSSKIEASQGCISREMMPISDQSNSSCASFKSRFLRFFKTGLNQGYGNNMLNKDSNTISNSSLKDTDDMDFICADLVKHMQQVNELL